jgi:flagellar basal-body rod protein FlgB
MAAKSCRPGKSLPPVIPMPARRAFRPAIPPIGTPFATIILERVSTPIAPPPDTVHGTGDESFRTERGIDMAGNDPIFGIAGDALRLRSQRMALLASNIANAATPNYKARDFDFQKALATASAGQGRSPEQAADAALGYRVPLETSLDGNTVELSTEQTLFAENAVQYRATLSFLQGRVSTLMSAIRGE